MIEELVNKQEVGMADLENSKPFQMTTGTEIKAVWSREKSEGVTVEPFAKTQKIKSSDYSIERKNLSRRAALRTLSVKPRLF